jgi:hypothetical protein
VPDGSWIYFQKDETNRYLIKVSGYTDQSGYTEFDIDKIIVQGTIADTDECDVKIDVAGAGATDISGKMDKVPAAEENNIVLFDASGNAKDSGELGEFFDIYNVPSDLKAFLEDDTNWLSGGNYLSQITATGFPVNGLTGMRFKDNDFFFECVSPALWTRYPVRSSYFDPYAIPATEKTKLENTSNWTGKVYTGTAITGCPIGSMHYNDDYKFEFVDTNAPIRLTRG